ncbi:hypothetical protein [Bradyrhizobium sp. CSA112]|uniref:hypothetical protein n=1 Tax=Bradyrhizobium sp. CSA112 TaxID=2699170 RepID=UPI0023B0B2ED|nr:hypothetical protein [Bradyrhizobium sp. CSA112]
MVRLHLPLAGVDGDQPAAGTNRPDNWRIEQPFDVASLPQAGRQRRTEGGAVADLLGSGKDAAGKLICIWSERRLQRDAFGRGQDLLTVLLAGRDNGAACRLEFPCGAVDHELAGGPQSERQAQGLRQPRQLAPAQSGKRELCRNGLAYGCRPAGEQESRAPGNQVRIEAGADAHRRIRRQQQRWQLEQCRRRRQRRHERVRELSAIGGAGVFRGGSMPVDNDDVVPGFGKTPCGRQSDNAGAKYTGFHFRGSVLDDRPIKTREPIGRRVVAHQVKALGRRH